MGSNKNLLLGIIAVFFVFFNSFHAQTPTKYWVKFVDKNGSPYTIGNPSPYLSTRSIARRVNQGITIDITDIPVNQSYINQVNLTGAQVFQRSKWLNAAVVIISNPSQLSAINSLTCVVSTEPVAKLYRTNNQVENKSNSISNKISNYNSSTFSNSYNYGQSYFQASQIGVDCMHNHGYRGQNMMIAVIDAGFYQVNINPVFDSLRNEARLLGTRDYVAGNSSVYEDNSHGANCLSLMAGNAPGQLIGTAPKSNYWLLRTEDTNSEKIIEECNWIIAAEFADSIGVDITTTSLGYTTFDISSQNHVYAHLNGKTSVASIAATMAARKGIFVLNAAGNDGDNTWQYIGVPADADSICTVGSVNSSGLHSTFSSIGPTADGRIKPDLSAMGEGAYICNPGFNFSTGNGTSYATPILAGAVACLWQANPTKNNIQILQALKATASKSMTPDNNFGWGIPNICAAHNLLNNTNIGINEFSINNKLALFPNPSNQYINFFSTHQPDKYLITDILGQNLQIYFSEYSSNLYRADISDLPNGVFFIKALINGNYYTATFIKY